MVVKIPTVPPTRWLKPSSCVHILLLLLWAVSPTQALFSGNSDDPPFLLFPRLQCYFLANSVGYDPGDFDRYGVYFREDSTFTLAQAGVYKGPDSIEEYVKFAFPAFSPYFVSTPGNTFGSSELPQFLEYENGLCVFLIFGRATYTMEPTTTSVTGDSPTSYDVPLMGKVYFDYANGYAPRTDIYYHLDFLELFFGTFLNSDETRRHTCSVLENECNGIIPPQPDDCLGELAAQPIAETSYLRVDGDSQGCRALHAAFAETNPDNHCAHVSLLPFEDPQGRIKCQSSSNIAVEDLFTEADMNAFAAYEVRNGIDPGVGHTFFSPDQPVQPAVEGVCSLATCSYLAFFEGWTMHTNSILGCTETCAPSFLITFNILFGWTCGTCP